MTSSVRVFLGILRKWMGCLGRLGGLVGHTRDRYACDFGEFRGQHSDEKLFVPFCRTAFRCQEKTGSV